MHRVRGLGAHVTAVIAHKSEHCLLRSAFRHPGFDVTPAIIDEAAANFRGPIPVDYESKAFMPDALPTVAEGWITRLTARHARAGSELWATIEWTAQGSRTLAGADGELFPVPVVSMEHVDSRSGIASGAKVISATLTRMPIDTGLSPVPVYRTPS